VATPAPTPTTTILDAEVDGVVLDVRVEQGHIARMERELPRSGTRLVRAGGAALLPGLHDHHLHLLAMAAGRTSVDVGPASDPHGFDRSLRAAHGVRAPQQWLRVVGYDECHGPLDRFRLDHLAPSRPVRVQHRSGAAWILSSAGLAAIGEHSAAGEHSDDGWIHRSDTELGRRWPGDDPPELAPVGRHLAALGVTGVTDATPFTDPGGFALLAAARQRGDLPQHLRVMGGPALAGTAAPTGLEQGPVKIVVADDALPSPDQLAASFTTARRAGRVVAVHCVTRVGLVLALAAWEEVGSVPGDRIEHASVVPLELIGRIAALQLQVVTQPAFIHARGDRYLAEVELDDQPHLYRCGSLLARGIGVGGSTDAPFGPSDPWLAIRTAVDRRTSAGRVVGPDEAIDAARALATFLSPLDAPGGCRRSVTPGVMADLCLLAGPLADALHAPSADHVRATWIGGTLAHGDP